MNYDTEYPGQSECSKQAFAEWWPGSSEKLTDSTCIELTKALFHCHWEKMDRNARNRATRCVDYLNEFGYSEPRSKAELEQTTAAFRLFGHYPTPARLMYAKRHGGMVKSYIADEMLKRMPLEEIK